MPLLTSLETSSYKLTRGHFRGCRPRYNQPGVEAKGPKTISLFGTPNNQRRLGLNNPVLPNIREPVGAGIPPKGASTLKGLGAGVVVESLNDSPPLIPRLLSGVEGPPPSLQFCPNHTGQ